MEHTTDIGSRIRQAREQRGLTIQAIANTTKIPTAALVAIEHNEFSRLPGGLYSRAYVRTFATEVGLDADELTREYRARFEVEIAAEPPPPRRPDWYDWVRLSDRLPAVLLTVSILIGGSVILQRAQIPHQSPGRLTVSAAEADLPEDPPPADERDAPEEVALATAAASETAERSLRLEIRLNGPCWVSAVADGQRLVYRLLQPGRRTLIHARSLITLRLGDAGAVTYSINGVTGRPLGKSGEAVTVRITHENLGSLSAGPADAVPAVLARRVRAS
jgi:transcriptional regulator with XRE-family HTH domain